MGKGAFEGPRTVSAFLKTWTCVLKVERPVMEGNRGRRDGVLRPFEYGGQNRPCRHQRKPP